MSLCNASGMSHKKLEQAFQEYIDRIEPFSEAYRLELQKQEQIKEQNQQLIQKYQDKQRQLDRKEKEILQLYVSNDIDFDSYRNMKKQIDSDRQAVQAELARLDMQEEQEPEIKREDIIAELKRNWKALTNAEKRQFLVRFVKRIVAVNEIPEGQRLGNVKIVEVEFHCN
jgi:putative heme degradation protein